MCYLFRRLLSPLQKDLSLGTMIPGLKTSLTFREAAGKWVAGMAVPICRILTDLLYSDLRNTHRSIHLLRLHFPISKKLMKSQLFTRSPTSSRLSIFISGPQPERENG
jgi:hypothetical protein